jgi:hypothetical protein
LFFPLSFVTCAVIGFVDGLGRGPSMVCIAVESPTALLLALLPDAGWLTRWGL